MSDISGFGLKLFIVASKTFPVGFTITQFADDADPFDVPELTIGEAAMGLNGDMVSWSKAMPIAINLNVIPNSDDDRNLEILFNANRVGKGRKNAKDKITMIASYPDGRSINLTDGKAISSIPFNAVASAGRLKSKPYKFMFGNG